MDADKLAWMKEAGIAIIPADVFYELSLKWPLDKLRRFDYYVIYNGVTMLYSYGYIKNTPLDALRSRLERWKERES